MPTLTINLTDYEFAALQRSAAVSGLSIEETARAILHGGGGSRGVAGTSGGGGGGGTATTGATGSNGAYGCR